MKRKQIDLSNLSIASRVGEVCLIDKVVSWKDENLQGAFVIVGAPDDRGVAIAKGRVGASCGPDAIRKELYKMTTGANSQLEELKLFDMGDVELAATQEETYQNLSFIIETILRGGGFPILLGGGHDLSYGGLSGFLKVYSDGGVINVDPHFDCRPIEKDGSCSSGVTFYRLIEEGKISGDRLVQFGYQAERNSSQHFSYLKEKGAHLIAAERLELNLINEFENSLKVISKNNQPIALSFDVDSIDAAYVPGVSALNVNGLSAKNSLSLTQKVAKVEAIKYLDFMELSPTNDLSGRSARLVALLIYHFTKCRI